MKHIVFFSSGAASFVAARRVAQKYGMDNLFLVFADTSMEDEDNYRFLREGAEKIGGKLIWLKDGRTPWDIIFQTKWIGHRQVQCSKQLKSDICRKWVEENATPENSILYFGINFEEIHRLAAIERNWQPYKIELPLCWDEFGWADREVIMRELEDADIKRPRLYDMGFSHSNCGGWCVRAGQAHFRRLLEKMPERYAFHEKKELEFQGYIGRNDVAIIRKIENGKARGMTLKEFRESIESELDQLSLFDEAIGGCGCFIDEEG